MRQIHMFQLGESNPLPLPLSFIYAIFILIWYHLIELSKWTTRHFHRNKMKWFTTLLTTYYTVNTATILIFELNIYIYIYVYARNHVYACLRSVNTTHQKPMWQNSAGFTFLRTENDLNTLNTHTHSLSKRQSDKVKRCEARQYQTKPNYTKQHDISVDNSRQSFYAHRVECVTFYHNTLAVLMHFVRVCMRA